MSQPKINNCQFGDSKTQFETPQNGHQEPQEETQDDRVMAEISEVNESDADGTHGLILQKNGQGHCCSHTQAGSEMELESDEEEEEEYEPADFVGNPTSELGEKYQPADFVENQISDLEEECELADIVVNLGSESLEEAEVREDPPEEPEQQQNEVGEDAQMVETIPEEQQLSGEELGIVGEQQQQEEDEEELLISEEPNQLHQLLQMTGAPTRICAGTDKSEGIQSDGEDNPHGNQHGNSVTDDGGHGLKHTDPVGSNADPKLNLLAPLLKQQEQKTAETFKISETDTATYHSDRLKMLERGSPQGSEERYQPNSQELESRRTGGNRKPREKRVRGDVCERDNAQKRGKFAAVTSDEKARIKDICSRTVCNTCEEKIGSSEEWLIHMHKNTLSDGFSMNHTLMCKFCKEVFRSFKLLKLHLLETRHLDMGLECAISLVSCPAPVPEAPGAQEPPADDTGNERIVPLLNNMATPLNDKATHLNDMALHLEKIALSSIAHPILIESDSEHEMATVITPVSRGNIRDSAGDDMDVRGDGVEVQRRWRGRRGNKKGSRDEDEYARFLRENNVYQRMEAIPGPQDGTFLRRLLDIQHERQWLPANSDTRRECEKLPVEYMNFIIRN